MSVSDAQDRIDSKEFTEWMAYYSVEPFGEERADIRSGVAAAGLATVWAGSKAKLKPKDFMPDFDKPRKSRREQTPEEMRAMWRACVGPPR